jgi:membrane associated rhomboid family serine protease
VFFPLRDENPTSGIAWVTGVLIFANAVAFLLQLFGPLSPEAVVHGFGLIPERFFSATFESSRSSIPAAWTLLSSMFLHGDILHLGGNLLYLWIFGNNVEDTLGHFRFLLLYAASGLGAHALHLFTNASSDTPTIGASGAIAGVLAAYLIQFPHARVVSLLFLGFFVRTVIVPASLVIGLWFVLQLLSGVVSLGEVAKGGVAWFEHIGGFVSGLVLFPLFRGSRRR